MNFKVRGQDRRVIFNLSTSKELKREVAYYIQFVFYFYLASERYRKLLFIFQIAEIRFLRLSARTPRWNRLRGLIIIKAFGNNPCYRLKIHWQFQGADVVMKLGKIDPEPEQKLTKSIMNRISKYWKHLTEAMSP